ncbi:hypothetical protein CJ030_MR5G003299 [Morella rubra]|uniref:Uncharacterized protein n=1 Tax=Morella rubra TaxID=262757 RepID=A0A6A1VPF5_9ROSI|nr:hypothetical protein CJ030_MR5G003299 [Morella rubra]
MVILVFAMVFGVYLYSICLKQIRPRAKIKFLNTQVIETPCHDHDVNLSEIPSVLIQNLKLLADKVYNLDWFSSASKNQCSAAVGFKWMLNQIQEEQGYCWESSGQIVLERCFGRALVRSWQSGSSLLLSAPKAEILSKYKPLINSRLLINDLKDLEVTTAKVLEYFNSTRHILLYYEDLTMNRTKLKDVQEFLKASADGTDKPSD